MWTSASRANWQCIHVTEAEASQPAMTAKWVNHRQQDQTIYYGHHLLYVSYQCPSQTEIWQHLEEIRSGVQQPGDQGGDVHQLNVLGPKEEEDWWLVIDKEDNNYMLLDKVEALEKI